MKAYLLEVLVVDHDGLGGRDIEITIENQKYPNWCISPHVMKVTERDIGEWHDDHPLNKIDQMDDEYRRLFYLHPV